MLPVLAHYFGLKPWEVDRLTYSEFEMFVATAEQIMKNAGS